MRGYAIYFELEIPAGFRIKVGLRFRDLLRGCLPGAVEGDDLAVVVDRWRSAHGQGLGKMAQRGSGEFCLVRLRSNGDRDARFFSGGGDGFGVTSAGYSREVKGKHDRARIGVGAGHSDCREAARNDVRPPRITVRG